MKYIKLTEADPFKDKTMFVRADQVTEFCDGKIYLGTGSYLVRESAIEIYDMLHAIEIEHGIL